MVKSEQFKKIYDATYDKVLSYVLAKCGKTDVEDIVQETYAELFEVLMKKGIAYIHCPEAFMMQLAKTKVHQYYSEKEYQNLSALVNTIKIFTTDAEEIYQAIIKNEAYKDTPREEVLKYLS